MCGKKRSSCIRLIVPSIDWSLNIVLVTQERLNQIYDSLTHRDRVLVQSGQVEMLFVHQKKADTLNMGISISQWNLGDSQVSRTRVSYEYVDQYRATFGTGFGSRDRSSCLDSVNSYRDKRFNARAQPSPLIHDHDIGQHQYYSSQKQRSCLLQMKLESVLHSLTSDITFVAERMNPWMVGITSGLSTKLIATTGKSMYSFCNGLHVDTCDRISRGMKKSLFKKVTQRWMANVLAFEHVSFPTTCGYQHVWKDASVAKKYIVAHHFVMPGLGIAVSLQDSIVHHFMGGAFSHCTSVCVLEESFPNSLDNIFNIGNVDKSFSVFAWGSAANARTARGNSGLENQLIRHRELHAEHRGHNRGPVDSTIAQVPPVPQEATRGTEATAGHEGLTQPTVVPPPVEDALTGNAVESTLGPIQETVVVPPAQAPMAKEASSVVDPSNEVVVPVPVNKAVVFPLPGFPAQVDLDEESDEEPEEEAVNPEMDDDNSSYSSYGFQYEDDLYIIDNSDSDSDNPAEKKQKVL